MRARLLVIGIALSGTGPQAHARANDSAAPAAPAAAPAQPPVPTPWPQLAAVFPGVLVHGSGVWLQGRSQTAGRLLLWEGTGVGLTLAAGVTLAATGAARDVVGPTALVAVAGTTLFATSFITNLYATLVPPDGLGQASRPARLVSRLGYVFVHDPQFDVRHFLDTGVDARIERWQLGARGSFAPDQGTGQAGHSRMRAIVGYRLLGPLPGEAARDGSYLDVQSAFTEERFAADGFNTRIFELAVEGRVNIQRYLYDVKGAFLQFGAGWGSQWISFEVPGVSATGHTSLLLAHVGFGTFLGNARQTATPHGEVELYYDHRHDGFAAGLKLPGLGSGAAGHFGLASHYFVAPPWGLSLVGEAGSAYTLGLGVLFREE